MPLSPTSGSSSELTLVSVLFLLLNTKNTLQKWYKDILTKWWVVILVARGPFFTYSITAQIITIYYIKYRHNNHQQILTYKKGQVLSFNSVYFFYYTKYNKILNIVFYVKTQHLLYLVKARLSKSIIKKSTAALVWLSFVGWGTALSQRKSRYKKQNQPPRGVLKKRCSENMQQIYRRTPMLKCNFNKVAFQNIYFQNTYFQNKYFQNIFS